MAASRDSFELLKLGVDTDHDFATTPLRVIRTTVDSCSLNVYASIKTLSSRQISTRAQLIGISSDGLTVRVGNQIFLSQPAHATSELEPFSPKEFSLHLEEVEQHGRYVFVTSRQKVLTMPSVSDQTSGGGNEPERRKATNGNQRPSGINIDYQENNATTANKGPEAVKHSQDSSESSDDADSEPNSEPLTEDADISAYESWSEASTEHSEDEIVPKIRPGLAPGNISRMGTSTTDEDSTSAAHSGSSGSDSEGHPTASSSESEPFEAENIRFAATTMDDEETDRMFGQIYVNDRDAPVSESDDNNGDYPPDGFWEDDGYDLFAGDDDFDGFQAMQSDSEECSDCGEDANACAIPAPESTTEGETQAENEGGLMLGTPLAQIHVYDVQTSDEDGLPTRVFRYACPTVTMPLLSSSPPAAHHTKPLVVWPLGDGKLLFADYVGNTYFIKTTKVSRMWSQHISITPRFSIDGSHLHIAIVEKHGRPPLRPRKVKKGQAKQKDSAKAKETTKYDLVVLTYRLSKRKTTRAPPMLVHREHVCLGPSKGTAPNCTWSDDVLFVSCIADNDQLEVYRVKPFTTRQIGNNTGVGQESSTTDAVVRLSIQLPTWAAGCHVRYIPADASGGKARILVAGATQHLKLVKVSKSDAEHNGAVTAVNQGAIGPGPADRIEGSDAAKTLERVRDANKTQSDTVSDSAEAEARPQPNMMVTLLVEGECAGRWFTQKSDDLPVDATEASRWTKI
ncbi:hypothetical protein LTR70_001411 [Exophiala xenobiotica]|uniref:Uncharacterized protein n=1 Tax=Lithohypha guttulata TaxID=1690604 RepID=A0ABR0KMF3_9EURO|nr:hypothetical protein LTR24_000835 [Lithohypha guttulata]KAK5328090.1 hypothetical protein LTR70_001411 [Exophiala xenobiotica]